MNNTFKLLNTFFKEYDSWLLKELGYNIFFTDSPDIFREYKNIINGGGKKAFGYHAIDLQNTTRTRISVNVVSVYKLVTSLSACEKLAMRLYEVQDKLSGVDFYFDCEKHELKNQLEVFTANYHPFDFFKFYEKRQENKINYSCFSSYNGVERESFNIGKATIFLVNDIAGDLSVEINEGKTKRSDRKFDPDFCPSFIDEDGEFVIFEFSGKSHYKSLFEMLDY